MEWFLNSGTNYSTGTNQTSWTSYNATDRNASNLDIGASVSDYLQITGVQLEVGTEATPFEHRPYDMELARCQRYYHKLTGDNVDQKIIGAGGYVSSAGYIAYHVFPTTMRAEPTINYSNLSDLGLFGINVGTLSTLVTYDESKHNMGFAGTASTSTAGSFAFLRLQIAANSYFSFSAEL